MSARQLWTVAVAVAAVGAALLLIPVASEPDAGSSDSSRPPVASVEPPNSSESSPNVSPAKPPKVASSSTNPVITPPPAGQETHPMHSQAPAPPKPARRIIVGFAQDFTNPGRGHADWWGRVSRWVSTDLAKQYRATAVARIPAGTPVQMETVSVSNSAVAVLIRYDTGLVLNCRVEHLPGGWAVTTADPAALP